MTLKWSSYFLFLLLPWALLSKKDCYAVVGQDMKEESSADLSVQSSSDSASYFYFPVFLCQNVDVA